jgi:hypothetical protein
MIIGYKAWYIFFFPCHLIHELKSGQATSQIDQGGRVVGHLGEDVHQPNSVSSRRIRVRLLLVLGGSFIPHTAMNSII